MPLPSDLLHSRPTQLRALQPEDVDRMATWENDPTHWQGHRYGGPILPASPRGTLLGPSRPLYRRAIAMGHRRGRACGRRCRLVRLSSPRPTGRHWHPGPTRCARPRHRRPSAGDCPSPRRVRLAAALGSRRSPTRTTLRALPCFSGRDSRKWDGMPTGHAPPKGGRTLFCSNVCC